MRSGYDIYLIYGCSLSRICDKIVLYLFELSLRFLVEEFIELFIDVDFLFLFELLLIIHSIFGLAVILARLLV